LKTNSELLLPPFLDEELDFPSTFTLEELLEPSLSLGMTLEDEELSLILEDDSSSSTAELSALFSLGTLVELESSPQALKANSAKATV